MRDFRFTIILLAAVFCGFPSQVTAQAPNYRLLGVAAPDFALRASSGVNMRLSEHRGEVVLLSFFAARCGQCAPQLGLLSNLLGTYRSAGLAALAVNVDDDQEAARTYMDGLKLALPLLFDPEKSVARQYRVDSLPMLLLIDRAGVVRHVHREFRAGNEVEYQSQIKSLLNE